MKKTIEEQEIEDFEIFKSFAKRFPNIKEIRKTVGRYSRWDATFLDTNTGKRWRVEIKNRNFGINSSLFKDGLILEETKLDACIKGGNLALYFNILNDGHFAVFNMNYVAKNTFSFQKEMNYNTFNNDVKVIKTVRFLTPDLGEIYA